jgi:hypothetical protein
VLKPDTSNGYNSHTQKDPGQESIHLQETKARMQTHTGARPKTNLSESKQQKCEGERKRKRVTKITQVQSLEETEDQQIDNITIEKDPRRLEEHNNDCSPAKRRCTQQQIAPQNSQPFLAQNCQSFIQHRTSK